MFRTRDFILLFTVIAFLVAAIGATLFSQWRSGAAAPPAAVSPGAPPVASTSDMLYTAHVSDTLETERIQRLNRLRDKVAQVEFDVVLDPEPAVDIVESALDEPEDTPAPEEPIADKRQLCPSHGGYFGFWDPRDLRLQAREGAIVVERALDTGMTPVLQLPQRGLPSGSPSCLPTDVVGIANDGSLIRNDELALYGVFGSGTRVGYALDGFPIYGAGTTQTDTCGGRVANGQYRYELSADRVTLVNCFAAQPVSLP